MAEMVVFVCESCGERTVAPLEEGAKMERDTGSVCAACLANMIGGTEPQARPRPQ